jgi:hypothetical protein
MSSLQRRRLNTDPTTVSAPKTGGDEGWSGPASAAPRVEMWARAAADATAELQDIARPDGWNQTAAEDALSVFELSAQALETLHPDAAEVLTVARRVAAELRRLVNLPPEDADSDGSAGGARTAGGPERRQTPTVASRGRRGLGPGWQGLREDGVGDSPTTYSD